LDQLAEDKKTFGHFMQDNEKAHAANMSMNALTEVSGERVVSR
jgi:hypothetical protein